MQIWSWQGSPVEMEVIGGKRSYDEQQAVEQLSQVESRGVCAPITNHDALVVHGKGQKCQWHKRQAPELEQKQRPALHSQPDGLTMPLPIGCDDRHIQNQVTSHPGHKL